MPEGITDMYGAEESFKEVAATKEVEEQNYEGYVCKNIN